MNSNSYRGWESNEITKIPQHYIGSICSNEISYIFMLSLPLAVSLPLFIPHGLRERPVRGGGSLEVGPVWSTPQEHMALVRPYSGTMLGCPRNLVNG